MKIKSSLTFLSFMYIKLSKGIAKRLLKGNEWSGLFKPPLSVEYLSSFRTLWYSVRTATIMNFLKSCTEFLTSNLSSEIPTIFAVYTNSSLNRICLWLIQSCKKARRNMASLGFFNYLNCIMHLLLIPHKPSLMHHRANKTTGAELMRATRTSQYI